MHFQMDVTPAVSPPAAAPAAAPDPNAETNALLRQLLEVQREHLAYMRAVHDANARWRAFVARWQEEFPELAASCREAVPLLERTYGALIAELGEYLRQQGAGALDNDFSLQEFLDRFGMRLAQLGTILNLVAPLAEAAGSQGEAS